MLNFSTFKLKLLNSRKKRNMKKNEYTKYQLGLALKELSKTNDLRKISISDICILCNMNRGTFYYHFLDKQELINWIYHYDITEPTRKILSENPESWNEISVFGLNKMLADKSFYLQAIKIDEQNNLKEYIRTEIEGNWNLMLQRFADIYYPTKCCSNLQFYSDFMANGAWATLIRWVNTGMKESPETLSKLIDTISGNSMKAIFEF